MADHLSPEKRSWNMRRIRSKDTSPELKVRSMLHQAGYRYRLNVTKMPGKPDIVLPRHRIVIFVNGCFWHRHMDCKYTTNPRSNEEYWQQKFEKTIERDKRIYDELRRDGWQVLVVWECQTHAISILRNLLRHPLPQVDRSE